MIVYVYNLKINIVYMSNYIKSHVSVLNLLDW